ncbi:hypothetical protein BOTBODRAFT_178749 [Botryobasidium botryosum FD-172 SS1]|uniref:Uncharacterized protein n=1 Tax=Botryobasidium botryosum (strain FD-172 SS1) TaxID=930990 RepID=A0A067M2S9_BOTB1|nr:hypothetical protein BOTBODRAFT_178749 [Botryobasidium botryosum FD-172 SS1]
MTTAGGLTLTGAERHNTHCLPSPAVHPLISADTLSAIGASVGAIPSRLGSAPRPFLGDGSRWLSQPLPASHTLAPHDTHFRHSQHFPIIPFDTVFGNQHISPLALLVTSSALHFCHSHLRHSLQRLAHFTLTNVEQFIFETAKISQLFCHQIIWNMKANCYKDDAVDKARDFYNREFDFFGEVTSISGKLKPFVKRTKAEKKMDEEMGKIKAGVGV